MTYRTLLTLSHAGRSQDYIVRDYDFGAMEHYKAEFIKHARKVVASNILPYPLTWIDHQVEAGELVHLGIQRKVWTWADTKAEWIKTYADRQYMVDLETGNITSPAWSQKMDDESFQANEDWYLANGHWKMTG
jgi:hypothetical protein